MSPTLKLLLATVVAIAIPASVALAMGFELRESKKELKLNYDVSIYDHDTGRVTIKFSLIDAGRLKPITSVDLSIPSKEKHDSGGFKSDLTMSMNLRNDGDKRVGSVHIRKDWAERAEIRIKTGHLDGKQEPLTWYYHSIPLNELVARAERHKTVN